MRPSRSVLLATACLMVGACSESTAPKPGTSVGVQVINPDVSPGDTAVFIITFGHADKPGDLLELEFTVNDQAAGIDTTSIPAGDQSAIGGELHCSDGAVMAGENHGSALRIFEVPDPCGAVGTGGNQAAVGRE